MLRSMTAYGRSNLKLNSGEFVCELRSVNHRYLDVAIRAPEALRSIEPMIRERLSAALQRGKIDVSLKYTQDASSSDVFEINESLLGQLTQAAGRVMALTGSNSDIDPLRLLQWPGVLSTGKDTRELLTKEAIEAFDTALADFVATREREGQQISQLLDSKCHQLQAYLVQVRESRPAVIQRQRDKWLAKLEQLQTVHDGARLEQELVYAAQRLDIDEEIDRLQAHCNELGNALTRSEPVGRRLDFLMQEFNREANTLASKSGDVGTTNVAVDIKVLIEQMREQVQNIE